VNKPASDFRTYLQGLCLSAAEQVQVPTKMRTGDEEEGLVADSRKLRTQLTCYVFPALLIVFVFVLMYMILRKGV
jgi:hypothetical protein